MVEDTIGNRDYVLKMVVNLIGEGKKYPNVRVAMCSSLNSMLKYLANYGIQNQNDKFETVIVYGHGSEGSINMGLGKIGIGPALPPKDTDYAKRKAFRDMFGLDKPKENKLTKIVEPKIRDLGMDNTDIWVKAFLTIKPYLEPSGTGYFHLFLMGCDVGKKEEGRHTTLQDAAAQVLSDIIDQNVCISAPTKTIYNDHLDYLLDNIKTIRNACVNDGENVYLKANPAVRLANAKAETPD
jgi:hypothetical protein